MRTRQKYRMRKPSTGREVIIEAEPGREYVDRTTGEPLEVVAMLLPLAPTASELPWAVENLRFCDWRERHRHDRRLRRSDDPVQRRCRPRLSVLPAESRRLLAHVRGVDVVRRVGRLSDLRGAVLDPCAREVAQILGALVYPHLRCGRRRRRRWIGAVGLAALAIGELTGVLQDRQ